MRLLKCQIFANYPIFIAITWKTTKDARKVRYNNTVRITGSLANRWHSQGFVFLLFSVSNVREAKLEPPKRVHAMFCNARFPHTYNDYVQYVFVPDFEASIVVR